MDVAANRAPAKLLSAFLSVVVYVLNAWGELGVRRVVPSSAVRSSAGTRSAAREIGTTFMFVNATTPAAALSLAEIAGRAVPQLPPLSVHSSSRW